MKYAIRHLIVMVGMAALIVVPSANARMGGGGAPIQQGSPSHGGAPIQQGSPSHGGAPMQQSSPSHWGNHWGGGFRGGDRFDHDRFRDRSSFFFVGAFPFGYPYYWPPYYYDYPPYYYDDYYYYGPRYYYDYCPPSSYH